MNRQQALEIVLDLALGNTMREKDCESDALRRARARQMKAISMLGRPAVKTHVVRFNISFDDIKFEVQDEDGNVLESPGTRNVIVHGNSQFEIEFDAIRQW